MANSCRSTKCLGRLWLALISALLSGCIETTADTPAGTSTVTDGLTVQTRTGEMTGLDDHIFLVSRFTDEVIAWDLATESLVWKAKLGSTPTSIAVSKDAIAVTLPFAQAVQILDRQSGQLTQRFAAITRPISVLHSDDGWVVSDPTDKTLILLTQEGRRKLYLTFAPNALLIDGDTLWIAGWKSSHIATVDLTSWKVTSDSSLTGDWQLNEQLLLTSLGIWIPQQRAYEGSPSFPKKFDNTIRPALGRLTTSTAQLDSTLMLDQSSAVLSRPIALAYDDIFERIWLLAANSNEVRLIDHQANLFDIGEEFPVGTQPRGLYLDTNRQLAWIWNALDYTLDKWHLAETPTRLGRYPLTNQVLSDSEQIGAIRFYDATDPRGTRSQWISCDSCHIDGGQDERNWHLDYEPFNTPTLLGFKHTGQLHWRGDRDELQDFELTFRQLMGGSGFLPTMPEPLGEPTAGKSEELDGLNAFLQSLPALPGRGATSEQILIGKQLFEGSAGCATCHSGSAFSDSQQKQQLLHDVGSANLLDTNNAFDTPMLKGVVHTPPYLHDGSQTLHQVLSMASHGNTEILTDSELSALLIYVQSL